jgi:hypothetical protein
MDVRIDEAGRNHASTELDQMSRRTDERFQVGESAVGCYLAARDCEGVAAGMTEDETLVKNQVGFPGRNSHFENFMPSSPAAGAAAY